MAEDREILQKVWEGRVAACITLAAEDLAINENLDPYYVMLPRVSYFPVALEKITRSVQKYVSLDGEEREFWIDYNGTPLKMQYPIGILSDLHNQDNQMPWQLSLHYSKLPASLISLSSRSSVESQFLSFVKEADALKHRSAVMQKLDVKDHKQLWQGIVTDKFSQFLSINQKLMDNSGSRLFRNIPFRVHGLSSGQDGRAFDVNAPAIMRLQKPSDDDGQPLLLSHLMEDTLADLLRPDDVLVVQGIVPPKDTPLLWLSQNLSHPDNFLHFCVRRPRAEAP